MTSASNDSQGHERWPLSWSMSASWSNGYHI